MKKTLFFIFTLFAVQFLSAQVYRIGDLVTNPDGSQGIVFYFNEVSQTGYMVALEDASPGHTWGATSHNIPGIVDIPKDNIYIYPFFLGSPDGYENTLAMKESEPSGAASCVDIDNGWYIPSAIQLEQIFSCLAFIEDNLTAVGGSTFNNSSMYWSSNEQNTESAYAVDFGYNYFCGNRQSVSKDASYRIRAVRNIDFIILPIIGNLDTPPYICDEGPLELTEPNHINCDTMGWEIAADTAFTEPIAYTGQTLDASYNGWFLRSWAANENGRTESKIVKISVGQSSYIPLEAFTCDNFYFWDGQYFNATGLYTHSYVNEYGCDSILELNLTIGDPPVINEIVGDTIIFIADDLAHPYAIDSIDGCLGYEWSINNPNWTLNFSSDSPQCFVTPTTREDAILTIKAYTRCGTAIKNIQIIHSAEPELRIYPNPTVGPVTFELFGTEGEVTIQIFNDLGQLIDQFTIDTEVSGTSYPYNFWQYAHDAAYTIRVFNHHQQITRRIVKQ